MRKGEDVSEEKIKTKRKKREHAVLGWQGKGRVRAMDGKEINRGSGPHNKGALPGFVMSRSSQPKGARKSIFC
jgi:hypothetical protein